MVVQIKGVSQGSAKFISRTKIGETTPSDYWYAKLDTTTTDVGNGVAVDSSGNVYIVGSTNSDTDVIILKYDKTGSLVWQRKLSGASSTENGNGIAVDNLGNVYIVGTINNGSTNDILIVKYNTSGTLLWQIILASSGNDVGNGIAVDSSGNVYITGTTGSTNDIITAKYDTNGNILWQRTINGNEGYDSGYGIVVDNLGNVYIIGIHLNNGNFTPLIVKYNNSGSLLWQRKLSTGSSFATNGNKKIAVDSSGNVYIVFSRYIVGSGAYDAIITKYDTLGAIQWQRKFGNFANNRNDYGNGIAVDSSGSVYITGSTYNGTNDDILIAKYDTLGAIQWQRTLASSNIDQGNGIAVDSSGTNVYITGSINYSDILIARLPGDGSIVNPTYTGKLKLIHSASALSDAGGDLTSSTPSPLLTDSAGTLDSFKCDLYSSDPALTSAIVTSEVPVSSTSSLTTTSPISVWTLATAMSYGTPGAMTSIIFDSLGNYYLFSANGTFALIVKYNSSGTILWQKRSTGFDNYPYQPFKIAIDSSNNVYTCGSYYNGSSYLPTTAKYDSSGNILWLRTFTNISYANTIAVDSSDNVYVTASSGSNAVIVKYNSSGTIQWQRLLSGSGASTNITSIAFDGFNNVYFCGSTGTYPNNDILIGKYNSSGVIQWQRTLNSGLDCANGITVDSSGNSYITGVINSNQTLILKYDTNGNLQWQRLLATLFSNGGGYGIEFDSNNNKIYIVGTSSNRILIAKYDTNGNYEWQRSLYFNTESAYGWGIKLNSSSSVYITGVYVNYAKAVHTLIAKIPSDGGTAGTYGEFIYAVPSVVASTPTLTSSVSSLTEQAASVTEGTTSPPSSDPGLTSNSPIAVQTLASAGTDIGNAIAVDSSGNYYITGNTGTDILIAKYNSSGVIQWQRTLASSGTDVGNGIAVDVSGNVYITGTSNDDIIIAKYNTSGTLQWQSTLASTSSTDLGNAIAVDSSGNVYITGSTYNGTTNDIILAKYDTNGAIAWQRLLASSIDNGNGIAVDNSGNVYIVGYTSDAILTIKCNTSSGTTVWQRTLFSLISENGRGVAVDSSGNVYIAGGSGGNAIIAKYDTNGNISPDGWQRYLATDVGAMAIAVDSSNNVYIVGQTGSDIVIAKYNTSGTIQWQRTLGSSNTDGGFGIAVDSSGSNVYITGNTYNDVIIAKIPSDGGTAGTYGSFTYTATSLASGTSTLTANTTPLPESAGTLVVNKNVWISTFGASGSSLESSNGIALDSAKNIYTIGKTLHTSGTTDSLLVKYNTSGTMQWQRTLTGSNSNDSGNGIAIDSFDNIYTVGTTGSNANDIAISKYNTSGVIQWQAILGTSTAQVGNGIAVDSSGNVYITGSILDGSYTNAVVAKYNSSGSIVWQRYVKGNYSSVGNGIIVDSSGNVYFTGKTILTGSNISMFIAKYTNSGTFSWAKTPDADYTDESFAISIDTSDNLYIAGFWGSYTSPYNPDAYIAKFDSSGTFQWQKSIDTASIIEKLFGIDVDSFGNSYTCGTTGTDILIIKYDPSGTILWSRSLTGTSTTDIGYGIQVDGDYVYITGSTSTGAKSLIAKLPNDGSYTGTYGSFTYSTLSLSSASFSLSASTSNLNSFTSTLTSSLILSSTDLNAPSVNNYLR
jgi:uncharacterized delta-60 repeat protein